MKLFIIVIFLVLGYSHPTFSKVISSLSENQADQSLPGKDNDRLVLEKRGPQGYCYGAGDPHYKTFDNKYYNFMGACRYVHVTDYCHHGNGKGSLGRFKVIAENFKCAGYVSCITAVDIIIGGETIRLKRGSSSPANMERPEYSVKKEGGLIVVRTIPPGLTVKYNMVYWLGIYLDDRFKGKVCGLCGNFDGNVNNDYVKSDGTITSNVNDFGQSWQAGGKCGNPVTPVHPCEQHPARREKALKDCAVIKSNHFKTCQEAMNVVPLYDNCIYDVCAGRKKLMKESSCEAIKEASLECKDKTGKPVSWGHLEQKCACQREARVKINDKVQVKCCHFPFEYKGVTFYDCVPQISIGNAPWCATDKMGTWRNSGECI